jgi:hypothetical protein
MKSKRNKPSYSGWTDQTVNDASIDSILDKFIKRPPVDKFQESKEQTDNPLSDATTSDLPLSKDRSDLFLDQSSDQQISISDQENPILDQKDQQNRLPDSSSLLKNESPACQNNSLLENNSLVDSNSLLKTTSLPLTNLWASIEHVKGHLKLPHVYTDGLARLLDPAEQVVYLQLFRLSWGYGKDSCIIGLPKLAERANVSRSTAQQAIKKLIKKNLVEKTDWTIGYGKEQGTVYRLPIPTSLLENNSLVNLSSLPESTPIKDHDDDLIKEKDHHQNDHQKSVMMIYQQTTGNIWSKADQASYQKIKHIPTQTIEISIRLANQRAANRPNSLAYFVKEILATANPPQQSRAQRKKLLEKVVDLIRTTHVGQSNYTTSDFVYDVKEKCIKEDIPFDNDIFNEIIAKRKMS